MGKITKRNVSGWTREQWLAERKKSIGGSDAGAVMGLSKYRSPLAVWADKTDPEVKPEYYSEAMRLGTDLEDYVAQRFMERTGKKVRNNHWLITNSDYPHLHANIDRSVVGENACLECKTASAYMADEWMDGKFPPSYYAQVATYMLVGEFQKVYLAVLILNVCFKVYLFTRDRYEADQPQPDWIDEVVLVEQRELDALDYSTRTFWTEYVETGTMPDTDATSSTSDVLNALADEMQTPDAEPVDLDDMAMQLAALSHIDAQMHLLQTQKDEIQNAIKQRMLTSPEAWSEDYHITWKPQTKRTFDWKRYLKEHPGDAKKFEDYIKESTSRVLRIRMSS